MDDPTSAMDSKRTTTRRTVLSGIGAVGLASLAGCAGDDGTGSGNGNGNGSGTESVPDPISINGAEKACDQCGMIIGNYLGPAGQSHYEDPTSVEGLGEDRPAQFCSSRCTYMFTYQHESQPQVSYLTDYSTVDYEVTSSGGEMSITRHLDADGFGDVTDLTMVVESDVKGAMGKSIIPFSDADEADDFQSEYGGEIYEHSEISQELVSSMMSGGMSGGM